MGRGLLASLLLVMSIFCNPCRAAELPQPIVAPNGSYIREFDLSADGRRFLWIAEVNNERHIYVRDLMGGPTATLPFRAGISKPHWAGDNRTIYAMADEAGDEKFHVFAYDADQPAKPPRDVTPFAGKTALLVNCNDPDGSAFVAVTLSSAKDWDLYRVGADNSPPRLIDKAVPGRANWLVDSQGRYFGRINITGAGKTQIEIKLPGQAKWSNFTLPGGGWRLGDSVMAGGDPLPDRSAWFLLRGSQDKATAQRLDLLTGKMLEMIPPDAADADFLLFDREAKPLLMQSVPGYPALRVFDPALNRLLSQVALPIHSYLRASSSDLAVTRLVLLFSAESGDEEMIYVDRQNGLTELLVHQSPPLLLGQLPRTLPVTLTSRDGLPLTGYVTLPVDRTPQTLPMVLMVHGGPWVRDVWGYDPMVNLLALQGYAVLRVNFRGSGGFGRAFEEAGVGEWGGKMQDDLTDAACWAIRQGVADPLRIAIMGGSYGGYAAIAALERTPKLYVAAIEQDGPVDLPAMLDDIRPVAMTYRPLLLSFIGADRKQQWERSPLAHIDRIQRPILGIQGVNDPRIRVTQLRDLEKMMQASGKEIETVYFEDEGHGVSHSSSFDRMFSVTRDFLKNHFDHLPADSSADSYCP